MKRLLTLVSGVAALLLATLAAAQPTPGPGSGRTTSSRSWSGLDPEVALIQEG